MYFSWLKPLQEVIICPQKWLFGKFSWLLLNIWLDTNPKAIFVKNIWKNLHTYQVSLKACVHFFHQMIAIEKLWKRLYISSKNPFGSRDILIFEIFSLHLETSYSKGQTGFHNLTDAIFEITQKPLYITSSNLIR